MSNRILKIAGAIVALLIVAYLLWYFSDILIYILLAGVLSFIGQPLVRFFDRIRISKFKMLHTLSAILALVSMLLILVSFFLIFVPVISSQAEVISNIDFDYLGRQLQEPLQKIEDKLIAYRIMEEGQSLEIMVMQELESVLDMASAGVLFQNVLGFAGSLFIGVFSVVFLTFFFLRDEHLFYNGIMLFIPTRYEKEGSNILSDTRRLLSRYFVGLSFEILAMITLITTGLTIFGVESALLIGFLGGLMNIIPYLGPIIGCTMGVVIAATSNISMGFYENIIPISTIIIGTFAVANLIDNLVLQPLIYSASVKSHPIEIFLVILMAGSLAGIPGMILAIPSYTVLRIISKQFFNQYKLVRKLTQNI
ncbi:MAG: AI-2E family transporter [Bacteroidales bacterium]|nr:AI-2E family transporter [Bacteroidales bacterium]